jgi:hypothetical protein
MSLLLKSRLLVSVQSDQDTRSDGFELLQLRAVVSGALDGGFAYYTQVEAASSPALVDAYVSYHPVPWIGLTLGRMKMPFAKEYLTSRTSLSFVDRSEIVLLTALKRGIGAQLSGGLLDKRLNYNLGVYNGTDMQAMDWGRQFLGAARIEAIPFQTALGHFKLSLAVGANAAYGMAEKLVFSQVAVLGDVGSFEGARALTGADMTLHIGPAWIAAEGIYGHYESRISPLTFDVSGGYAELGATLLPDRFDIMLRYDALWVPHTDSFNQFVIAGLRVFATEFFTVQLNYAWGFGTQSGQPQGIYWSRNQLIAAFQLLL